MPEAILRVPDLDACRCNLALFKGLWEERRTMKARLEYDRAIQRWNAKFRETYVLIKGGKE